MSTYSEHFRGQALAAKSFEYPSVIGGASNTPQSRPAEPEPEAEDAPVPPAPPQPTGPVLTESDIAAAFERGRMEGRLEAEHRFNEQLAQAVAEERARIDHAIDEFQHRNNEYYSKVETQLVHLAMGIAAKILHRESQVDPMMVAALVKLATENLKQGSHVEVHIAPGDVQAWRNYFAQDGGTRVKIEVVEDPSLEPGDCVLHSEVGSADLGITAQLKEIERGLFDLLAQRPTNG